MDTLKSYATYKVISHSELDGIHVDHFVTHVEARNFAKDAAREGFDCLVCKVFESFDADDLGPEFDYGVVPGVDYPATLHP